MGWEEQIWVEMEQKTEPEKIIMAGDAIAHLMRYVLPRLANERRMAAVRLVESGAHTATTLAESIGARPGNVKRLVEEGRRLRREAA